MGMRGWCFVFQFFFLFSLLYSFLSSFYFSSFSLFLLFCSIFRFHFLYTFPFFFVFSIVFFFPICQKRTWTLIRYNFCRVSLALFVYRQLGIPFFFVSAFFGHHWKALMRAISPNCPKNTKKALTF